MKGIDYYEEICHIYSSIICALFLHLSKRERARTDRYIYVNHTTNDASNS